MDDGPEQGGQDDYESDVAARAAPRRNRKPLKSISSPAAQGACAQCRGEQFGIVAVRAFSGLMSSADALAKAVRLGESQRPLPVQAIGVEVNALWQKGSFMGCFQVRSRERFPVSQNVGKRDGAVRAALGLFQ